MVGLRVEGSLCVFKIQVCVAYWWVVKQDWLSTAPASKGLRVSTGLTRERDRQSISFSTSQPTPISEVSCYRYLPTWFNPSARALPHHADQLDKPTAICQYAMAHVLYYSTYSTMTYYNVLKYA